MDNTLDFTISDSFESNVIATIKKNKQIMAEFPDNDDEVINENLKLNTNDDNENVDVDVDNNDVDIDGPHSSTFIDQTINDYNERLNKYRRSITRLLNIHEPLDLDFIDNDDNVDNDKNIDNEKIEKNDEIDSNDQNDLNYLNYYQNNRLRNRLNKLSEFYKEDNDNNIVVMREKQNFNDKDKNVDDKFQTKRLELRYRLKSIADSYCPITDENQHQQIIKLQISSPKSQPLIEQKEMKLFSNNNNNLNKSKSVINVELKQTIITSKENNNTNNKLSVSNLKKFFEKKSENLDNNNVKEMIAPELLPVREKKRLFENVIRKENEAKSKQYKQSKPIVINRLNINKCQKQNNDIDDHDHDDDHYHNPKRIKEIETEPKIINTDIDNNSDDDEEQIVENQLTNDKQMIEAICETFKSIDDIKSDDEDDDNNVDDDQQQQQYQDPNDLENENLDNNKDKDQDNQDENQQKVGIDSDIDDDDTYSEKLHFDEEEEIGDDDDDDENMMEITFSAIEQKNEEFENVNNKNDDSDEFNLTIRRSSTEINLSGSNDDHYSNDNKESLKERQQLISPIKSDDDDNKIQQSNNENNEIDEEIHPPIRTISHYREEQKRIREMDRKNMEFKHKCNKISESDNDDNGNEREKFLQKYREKIIELENEMNDHLRIKKQAETALSLSLSLNELRYSDSRIEAERLLLISNENILTCQNEINNLQIKLDNYYLMMKNNENENLITNGTIYIDNIKLPLLKEYLEERSRGKKDKLKPIYFICLIYYGSKIFVSKLLNTLDNLSQSYLNFIIRLNIEPVSNDFKIIIKFFSLNLSTIIDDNNSTNNQDNQHNNIKYLSPFKTIRKKLMHSSSMNKHNDNKNFLIKPKQQQQMKSSNFKLIGFVKLTLQNVKMNQNKFYCINNNQNENNKKIIDNYLTMNINMKILYQNKFLGYFDMKIDDDSSFWNVRYLRQQNEQLYYYRFGEEKQQEPLGRINLKYCINPVVDFLKIEHRYLCRRANSFLLMLIDPSSSSNNKNQQVKHNKYQLYYISSQSEIDCRNFCSYLNQLLVDIRLWERDVMQPMDQLEFDQLLSNLNNTNQ